MSKIPFRVQEWIDFSKLVENHIREYTVKQYGDYPTDQMTTASLEDIQHDMKRYINRMNSNARGSEEALRDLLKISHYCAILWGKISRSEIELNDKERQIIFVESIEDLISKIQKIFEQNEIKEFIIKTIKK